MSKKEKPAEAGLDISGLLALKTYERPESARIEKNIQNVMRAVRTTNQLPYCTSLTRVWDGWLLSRATE